MGISYYDPRDHDTDCEVIDGDSICGCEDRRRTELEHTDWVVEQDL